MKKVTKILASAATAAGLFLANPIAALAADPLTNINLRPNDVAYTNIVNMQFPTLISGAIKLVLVVAALVFFFVLVIGGIQWILSGGDKAGAETARKRITSALVGLAIVFVAWAIGTLIQALFGFDIFNLNIPKLY